MIWTVVSKAEMAGYVIPPVFQYYREVVGKENIELKVIDEDDPLDFVQEDDTILLRTASKSIVDTIKSKCLKSTAENYDVYSRASDKETLARYLSMKGIVVPKQYLLEEVEDDKTYFVKPRYGSESFGITPECICHTKKEVKRQVERIREEFLQPAVIEEFIYGVDCTTAIYRQKGVIHAHTIKVECGEIGGIQTHKGKFAYDEYCSPMHNIQGETMNDISRLVGYHMNIRHHARIDFRLSKEGVPYMIDVNLLPGLGPSAHFSKCLLLTDNISYKDAIWAIIRSASK